MLDRRGNFFSVRGRCLACILLALGCVGVARSENGFGFCISIDLGNKRDYFSDIFEADWLRSKEYQNGFNAFLSGHYGLNLVNAICFVQKERGAAKEKMYNTEAESRRDGRSVTETGWTY
jgi:hypothetical protein